MPNPGSINNPTDRKAYVITGPTSGIGKATALEMAKHGQLVLVGRNRERLKQLQRQIERKGHHAVMVVCDLSDIVNVRRSAAEIVALNLSIAGLLNNAGIMQMRPTKNALGWDMSFVTTCSEVSARVRLSLRAISGASALKAQPAPGFLRCTCSSSRRQASRRIASARGDSAILLVLPDTECSAYCLCH
jgi:NAD(P)-dependent dehydrogenase (short-subunit alcohol dehydrogenase family)